MKLHYKIVVICILTLVLLNSSHAQQPQTDSATTQAQEEIDACIAKFYKILSYQNSKLDNLQVDIFILVQVKGCGLLLFSGLSFT